MNDIDTQKKSFKLNCLWIPNTLKFLTDNFLCVRFLRISPQKRVCLALCSSGCGSRGTIWRPTRQQGGVRHFRSLFHPSFMQPKLPQIVPMSSPTHYQGTVKSLLLGLLYSRREKFALQKSNCKLKLMGADFVCLCMGAQWVDWWWCTYRKLQHIAPHSSQVLTCIISSFMKDRMKQKLDGEKTIMQPGSVLGFETKIPRKKLNCAAFCRAQISP